MSTTKTKLTPKERAAVHSYVECGTKTEAYLAAYPASRRYKSNTLRTKAYELFKRPHVAKYLAELEEEARAACVMNKDEALGILADVARGGSKALPASWRDRIASIERLAKLMGWDKPTKLEAEGLQINLHMGGASSVPAQPRPPA